MSIIGPAVLTAAQLVSGVVSTAKTARDLAKDSSNHELKAIISELYDAVLDVKGRVLDLDEDNRRLKEELARKDEIVGPLDPHGYFFRKDKPDQPLCPKCIQSQPPNLVFLSPVRNINGGTRRSCVVCRYFHNETPLRPQQIRIAGGVWS
ncbi:MAG: hypothetical protein WBQ94_12245 [Terracidiphilus sp.]